MGCCCSRRKRARRDGAPFTSSELTSSISSIPSSSLKPEAKLSSKSLEKQDQVSGVTQAPAPVLNGISEQKGVVVPTPSEFLRCPSVVLFEDDTFFDAQEELQQEAPHQSRGLDVLFDRYENWMVHPWTVLFDCFLT